ncbi:MAG: hypothetical protein ACT4TC_10935, partial [Myxococcaceae bacterium]
MRGFSTGFSVMVMGAVLALGGTAWAGQPDVVVVAPSVSNWCQLQALPPVPAPKGERAVVRVPAENPGLKDEIAKLGISVAAEYSDAMVIRAKPGDIRTLHQKGITVQREPAGDVVVFRGVDFDTAPGSNSPRGAPPPPAWLMRVGPADRLPWLVQFVGPVTADWMNAISTAGGQVLENHIASHALVARLTAAQADVLRRLAFVQGRHPLGPPHKNDTRHPGQPRPGAPRGAS